MANTPFKNVTSREIYGSDISGLQDAVNKVETVLDMQTADVTGHAMLAVSDQPEPALNRRIYEGTIRNWLEAPVLLGAQGRLGVEVVVHYTDGTSEVHFVSLL